MNDPAGGRCTGTEDSELPEDLQRRPEKRHLWDAPTAWLLGTKLLTSLRDIALTAVFHFEPRDWMNAGPPIDLRHTIRPTDGPEPEGCWIDYLADTGDSPRLVWQLAYLLQQRSLKVHVGDGDGDEQRLLAHETDGAIRELPRGATLVVGGDTAYPIATRRRLLERVRAPFIWARKDLAGTPAEPPQDQKVALLGIPGNHDYYNALNGYERQFHDRCADRRDVPSHERVELPGYELLQKASYFAVLLPYGWQLWGLDIEVDRVDGLQAAYFRAAAQQPDSTGTCKRIIATSRPMFVYHAPNECADELRASFRDVDLAQPFDRDGDLDRSQIRLDLSGDVHVYERYWGKDEPVSTTSSDRAKPDREPPRDRSSGPWQVGGLDQVGNESRPQAMTSQRANYASVVSGLGGAFHHPSQVRFGHSAPRNAWPDCGASAAAIGQRLVHPHKVFQAGAAGVIGLIVAGLCYGLLVLLGTGASLLDAPFGVSGARDAAWHCVITLSILATIAALIGVIWLGVKLGNKLAGPIARMEPAASLGRWAHVTRQVSHHRAVAFVLRWLGGNLRTVWAWLIMLPAWGPAVALCGVALVALLRCPDLIKMRDGFEVEYVVVLLVIGAMAVLGAAVGGKHGGVFGRIFAGILGLLIGALIVWTPHAWTQLMTSDRRLWALAFFAYAPVRWLVLRERFFSLPARRRRVAAVAVFAGLVALFVGVPCGVLGRGDVPAHPPWWGIGFAMVFGAYLTCLWLGWYFFLCLQWNGHGNEAGGAARVVSFAEFLRIKLTADRAEVWVIGAEGPHRPWRPWWRRWLPEDIQEQPPRARLIDHFVVGRRDPPG